MNPSNQLIWHESEIRGGAVAIGIFDGVHQGHQLLLERARSQSERVVALTFYPHPTAILAPEKEPTFLLSLEDRVAQLRLTGADSVAVHPFTKEFAALTPDQFIEEILIGALDSKHVVVGSNFTFGAKASGDVTTLSDRKEFSLDVVSLAEKLGEAVSSTRIRKLIRDGAVEMASELLTRAHQLTGEVVHGEKRGREIGYPTANLALDPKATVPKEGVYAGWLTVGTSRWQAAISIGRNPTFPKANGERAIQVEAYAIDEVGLDLYGKDARIEFGYLLRETLKFDSLDALLAQMRDDVNQARKLTQIER
ncbi:MAG: bifunctional riboflavin kinase/FAD synthetase [Actinobacteria bacterium]|nr:bifunctional riboflavin kinase/FAD synthetase [Actinomycetota bacterium]